MIPNSEMVFLACGPEKVETNALQAKMDESMTQQHTSQLV